MANTWRRFWAAFAMELRLHCFHWTYPALHVAWSVLIWFMYRQQELGNAHTALEAPLGRLSVGMVSLVALFVAGAAASRSERIRFVSLEQSLPTGAEVVLGRWLATLTAIMGAMIQPLVYAWTLGPAASWWEGAPIFLGEGLLIVGFVTAFAWWLVSRIGMRRWLYPVMAAGWLGLLVVPAVFGHGNSKPAAVRLLDIMRLGNSSYVDVWGRMLEGQRPLWFDLFYAGLALLFVALVAERVQRVRLRRRPLVPILIVLAALATATIGGGRFVADNAKWNALIDADSQDELKTLSTVTRQGQDVVVIDRSEVTADFRTPADPHYTARVVLRNVSKAPAAVLDLTLSRQLKITAASLPYGRDGDFLALKPGQPLAPGASITVDIAYGGPIVAIRRAPDSTPLLVYFTTGDGVRLADQAGWYPVAGRRWLSHGNIEAAGAPAAPFRLELRAPEGWGVVTNLPESAPGVYEAQKATWVGVVASPRMTVKQSGNLTLAVARNDFAVLEPTVRDYAKALGYLARFFPAAKPTGVTVVALGDLPGFPNDTPPADGQVTAWLSRFGLVGSTKRPELSYFYIGRSMLEDLWAMSGSTGGPGPVGSTVDQFLWRHYRFQGDINQIGGGFVGQVLKDLQQSQGEAAVIRVMGEVQAHPEVQDLAEKDLAAWMKEAAGREK